MPYELLQNNASVRANCPECQGAVTTYESASGTRLERSAAILKGEAYDSVYYYLLRCAGCGRGGLSTVGISRRRDKTGNMKTAYSLVDFSPTSIETYPLPGRMPAELNQEFREAELVASVGAWRAASALMRSVLEKALKHSGYTKDSLKNLIDKAAADGTITAARSLRAHEDIRVLGNDVLHDDWRPITQDEFELSHRYTQRILEDLYDDRDSVLTLLKGKNRSPVDG